MLSQHNCNLKKIILAGWDKKYLGLIILTLKRSTKLGWNLHLKVKLKENQRKKKYKTFCWVTCDQVSNYIFVSWIQVLG